MLQLINIKKDYHVASKPFTALKDVNLTFRANEFVSILGPSGSGKTTLLNIIGGLDRYTSGDLLIDGKSTKEFKDSDWDSYRNTTVGFVFQNYNLIPHLSVLDNVIMALKLSGISAKESKERAIKVLTDVGLADHLYKRPNQLSGGQMQRVAIARALVNNPKVLLADEPTGALDSKTSVQIMELIKQISKDRLVIMVTHNAQLAEQYSDRIIRLLDGKVIEDTNPTPVHADKSKQRLETQKVSMPYTMALKTSFNNLLTKKWRTLITMFAGSIGIIGIALVLAISAGMNRYIDRVQSDLLSGFPLTIMEQHIDFDNIDFRNLEPVEAFPDDGIIRPYDPTDLFNPHINVMNEAFIAYLEAMDPSLYNAISFSRAMAIQLLARSEYGDYRLVSSNEKNSFLEIPNNPEFIQSQYDVLSGHYPEKENELVLIIDSRNRINKSILEDFGIEVKEYRFDEVIGRTFKVIPNNLFYVKNDKGYFDVNTDYEAMYNDENAIEVKIVGILRVKPESPANILNPGIGYTTLLTDYLFEDAQKSDIVQAQIKQPDINVLTGNPFNPLITYDQVMRQIGGSTQPTQINIFPVSFEAKEKIKEYIDAYNQGKANEDRILYTDISETVTKSVSRLINTISIILSAFAGISLVVSSIMIGIITYVSVVERTKEIGIMRAIGARKKDISRIFNAEAMIIGFGAGIVGIICALILIFPINHIINRFTNMAHFSYLPIYHAALLILLSTILTTIAGIVPASIAARKDPVEALRTE